MRVLGMLVALLALVPAVAQGQVRPDQDPFYAPPANLAQLPNGTVVQRREVEVSIPAVRATQLQYRSTDARGAPIAPVTTVLEPLTPYLGGGERPLIGYQVGYDGLGAQCMPSYTLRTGNQPETGTLLMLLQVGFAVELPDHEGPTNAWTVGPLAGHVVLDGVRAAQTELSGTATPTALYGYSGGGQATAWAAEQLPAYAPELTVAAVAAGGLTPDPEQLIRFVDGSPAAGIAYAALAGLERQFPELRVDALLNDRGRQIKSDVGDDCGEKIADDHGGVRLLETFTDPTLASLFLPRVQRVFEANRLGKEPPPVPVYLFHSAADERVPVAGTDALATKWCAEGASVFYDRRESGGHASTGLLGAVPAVGFLVERLAGSGTAPVNCGATPPATIAEYCPGGATAKIRLMRINGEKVRRVVVRDEDGVRIKSRRGLSMRRIVLRGLTPGEYRFRVTRFTDHYVRSNFVRRVVVCKRRAI